MIDRRTPRVVLTTAMYPPDPRVGAIRPAKLVRHLVARGFEVHVVTSAVSGATPGPGPAGEQIHVIQPRVTLRDRYAQSRQPGHPNGDPGLSADAPRRPSRINPSLRSVLLAPFVVPDLQRGIIGPMAAAARKLLAEAPSILYSTAPPHSTNVAARIAVSGRSTPWVAEFRDPWTDSKNPHAARAPWLCEVLNRALERLVMNRADYLIGVSEGIGGWMRRKAPDTPIVVSRNGIDDIADPDPELAPASLVEAVYSGELYLGRDPRAFFGALATLRQSGVLGPETFRCRMVGDVEEFQGVPTQALAARDGVDDMVSLEPRVSRDDAIALQRRADLLVLFAQQQPLQVPNKLYEYLGSRKPILAFADEAGETARLLRDVGGHHLVTEHTAPPEAARIVGEAIRASRQPAPVGDLARLRELAAPTHLDAVADLLKHVWARWATREDAEWTLVDPVRTMEPGVDSRRF